MTKVIPYWVSVAALPWSQNYIESVAGLKKMQLISGILYVATCSLKKFGLSVI